jgi:hypothetical protein
MQQCSVLVLVVAVVIVVRCSIHEETLHTQSRAYMRII